MDAMVYVGKMHEVYTVMVQYQVDLWWPLVAIPCE